MQSIMNVQATKSMIDKTNQVYLMMFLRWIYFFWFFLQHFAEDLKSVLEESEDDLKGYGNLEMKPSGHFQSGLADTIGQVICYFWLMQWM